MSQKRLVQFCLLLVAFAEMHCAKILGIVPTPSYSHQIVYQPIWRELSLRGHQVTVLTTDPQRDPSLKNLIEIDLHFSYDMWNEVIEKLKESVFGGVDIYYTSMANITDQQLQHPKVQSIIQNQTEHFDVVLVEFFLPIMFAFKDRFNCPMIGVLSMDAPSGAYKFMGNPSHPVLYPDFMLPFAAPLNFVERLISVISLKILHNYFLGYLPLLQSVVDKNFPRDQKSDVYKLMESVDMLFLNTNPILYPVRPLIPTIVQIGDGLHLKPPKQLPKKVQEFLDDANDGAIYFSLGTNAKSKDLSNSTISTILSSFSELPYKVLWKFEADNLLSRPENVMISKWFPQQDVLRHPNIKLFISQCGVQSTEEALMYGVPILGMPMLGDQTGNVKRLVSKGIALSIDIHTLTKNSLKSTILELIQNEKYKIQMKKLSSLVRDQPMTGLEKAIWWTEYVIRNKGAKHLKSRAIHSISTTEYYLLDVAAFSILALILIFSLLIFTIKMCYVVLSKILNQKSKIE